MTWSQIFRERVCRVHGRTTFKLGFCALCIANVTQEEVDNDALYILAMRQLTNQAEAGNEVFADETEENPLSPTAPKLPS